MADETAEALQRAAVELIGAARAFLDVAEALVRDPATVTSIASTVVGMVRAVGEGVAAAAAPGRSDDDEPGFERIDLG